MASCIMALDLAFNSGMIPDPMFLKENQRASPPLKALIGYVILTSHYKEWTAFYFLGQ